MVERRTPDRESRVRAPRPPCSILEQDTLSSKSTQEAVAPSRHDSKIVDRGR